MSDRSAADIHEIANLKARYCAVSDLCAQDPARARPLFADMFAPDVVGDYGVGPPMRGGDIVEFLASAIAANSDWMWHSLSSPRIMLAGDAARGMWTVMVMSRRKGGEEMTVYGRYADAFTRTTQGWRISAVKFRRAGEEIDL